MIIEMIKEKNISSECSSSEDGSEGDYSDNEDQPEYYDETEGGMAENTTKASEQSEEYNECFEDEAYDENEKENAEMQKRNIKRRRKNKNLKVYEASFEKTYETLVQLEKTLGLKKDDRLPCNL